MLFDPTQDYSVIDCFPHTINVLAKQASTTFGGQATYTTAYANATALVTRAGSDLKRIYEQRNVTISHRIYVQVALSLTTGAIVQFQNSRYFFIHGVNDVLESGQLFALDTMEIEGTEIVVEN